MQFSKPIEPGQRMIYNNASAVSATYRAEFPDIGYVEVILPPHGQIVVCSFGAPVEMNIYDVQPAGVLGLVKDGDKPGSD